MTDDNAGENSAHKIVFHVPYKLQEDPGAASGVRPAAMLNAFRQLGYEITEVSGTPQQRRRQIRALRLSLRAGEKFEFAYSESSTQPNALSDPGRRIWKLPLRHPLRPFLDRRFFRLAAKSGIPLGVFYRDVYWAFPNKSADRRSFFGRFEKRLVKLLHKQDIRTYNRYVDTLFVPSVPMAKCIPGLKGPRVSALPPASPVMVSENGKLGSESELQLFYVGGLGAQYDLTEAMRTVSETPRVTLTVCVPEDQWQKNRGQYAKFLSPKIEIVHKRHKDLERFYECADIGMLFVEPTEYRSLAAPLKLFEYIGHGKPVIASADTWAAHIVEQTGVGWAIPYEGRAFAQLLHHLTTRPEEVQEKAERARAAAFDNTWEARARLAAETLVEGPIPGSH